jgi:hypothetical protein
LSVGLNTKKEFNIQRSASLWFCLTKGHGEMDDQVGSAENAGQPADRPDQYRRWFRIFRRHKSAVPRPNPTMQKSVEILVR